MKAISLFACLILSSSLFASFPEMRINSFTGSFTSLSGTGTATRFTLSKAEQAAQTTRVKMQFYSGDLTFDVAGKKYVMTLAEDQIKTKDSFNWKDVNLLAGGRAINGSAERISVDFSGVKANLDQAAISCSGNQASSLPWTEQLLDFCTTNSEIELDKFSNESLKENDELNSALANILEEVFPSGVNDTALEGGLAAKDINLTVKNHSFKLKGQAKFGVYVAATANGYMHYLRDSKTVRVKLDKVSAVFFNVTDKVFTELEKISSDKIRVERPYIYLNL